jgi:hypothetical protein
MDDWTAYRSASRLGATYVGRFARSGALEIDTKLSRPVSDRTQSLDTAVSWQPVFEADLFPELDSKFCPLFPTFGTDCPVISAL